MNVYHLELTIFLIAQEEGRWEDSLKTCKKCMKVVQNADDEDMPTRSEIMASLHSYMGNAYLELEEFNKALDNHQMDLEIGQQQ